MKKKKLVTPDIILVDPQATAQQLKASRTCFACGESIALMQMDVSPDGEIARILCTHYDDPPGAKPCHIGVVGVAFIAALIGVFNDDPRLALIQTPADAIN